MLKTVACCLAMGFVATAAMAQPAPAPDEAALMADFYGNVLQIDVPSVPKGYAKAERVYAPDHTYREKHKGGTFRGTWSIEDGKICAAQDKPGPNQAKRYCNVGLGKHLGDSWTDADPVTGALVTFALTKGP